VSFVNPAVSSCSRGFIQNLGCHFWTFLQVSTNFGSLNCFLLFKTIRKDFKRNSQSDGPNPARGRRPIGRGGLLRQLAVSAWRPIGRPGPAVAAAHGACVRARQGAVTAAEAGTVARAATAHRRLAWHGVEGEGMRAVGGVRWARRETVRLTEEVGRR
jgi:hypothetical protein